MAAAQVEAPIPPVPQRWVTDEAGFLSPAVRDELDARLEAFERSSGRQLIVYIGKSSGIVPIEDWAVRAFEAWKIGRKGLDDGLAVFVMAADRRMRIEVGYGLEGEIPDIIAGRIINDGAAPLLKAGDNDGAMRLVVNELLQRLGASAEQGRPEQPAKGRPLTPFEKVLIALAVIGFIILFITSFCLAARRFLFFIRFLITCP